ncbi:MAG: response regulator, partial [Oscillospiraceae bacterium]|nr:response regulator [Oscillospiraceae bacterium]
KIREFNQQLPVYAITANATEGEEFYRTKGFNGYLPKPIDCEALERTIMQHVPDKMMKKFPKEEKTIELTELPSDMLWIYETSGISAEEGIKNSGSISNFIFSLKLFLDTISGNAKVIREAYESKNIRLLTIKIHALKISARIIGASELYKLAEKMEDAGNHQDMTLIDENIKLLLSNYEAYEEKLSRLKQHNENA